MRHGVYLLCVCVMVCNCCVVCHGVYLLYVCVMACICCECVRHGVYLL